MHKILLSLENTSIIELNALCNAYTVGFPGITNFVGLGKAIEMKFKTAHAQYELKFNSVAIVIQEFNLQTAHPKFIKYRKNDDFGKSVMASTVDVRHANSVLNLYFNFSISDDYLEDNRIELSNFIETFQLFMSENIYRFRVAGGTIIKADIKVYPIEKTQEIIKKLSNHFFILEDISTSDYAPNSIEQTINLFRKTREGSAVIDKAEGMYWLLQIGYKLLEQPIEKEFARGTRLESEKKPRHSYAEPILVPVRLRSLGSYKKNPRWIKTFWAYSSVKSNLLLTGAN